MMITVAFLLVLPAFTFSQAIIRNETSPVCSLQLSDSISKTAIERTNDWTITPWTSYTLWPAAKFFFTRDGELYGNNGQFCSFSPCLKCAFTQLDSTTGNFTITQNGSVSIGGRTEFWYCPDPDGDAHHAQAAPLIFPPQGVLPLDEEPDYSTCNKTTLSSATCRNRTEFKLDPQRIMLGSGDSSSQQTVTGNAVRTAWKALGAALAIVAAILCSL